MIPVSLYGGVFRLCPFLIFLFIDDSSVSVF